MSLLSRLAWKSLPKQQRKLLLSLFPEPNRQVLNSVLSNRTSIPQKFIEHNFIFVHVPKVAGISLIHALGFESEHKWHMPLKYYQHIVEGELDKYFKFAFVRNPWDRALSAYHFLLQGGLSEKDHTYAGIIKKYRSYEDFILRWLSTDSALSLIHFTPMYKFLEDSCGTISMDFIGRYESIQHDYNHIRSKLGIGTPLPWKNTSTKNNFQDIYTAKMIDKIAKVYERDISEFNYDY